MAGRNISVSEASRPVLPRHAKLRFDETRKVWVILAPEQGNLWQEQGTPIVRKSTDDWTIG